MPAISAQINNIAELERRLAMAHGGGNGIMRNEGDQGAVTAQSPLSMRVDVGTFRGYINKRMARLAAVTQTQVFVAPTGGAAGEHRRTDLVQYKYGVGVHVKTGVESGAPVAPSVDADAIRLAEVRLRKGMAVIKDTDDSVNGWIVDARMFI